MRSSCVVRERLTANVEVATVLGSFPASSDTEESETVLNKVHKKSKKIPLLTFLICDQESELRSRIVDHIDVVRDQVGLVIY